MSAADQVSEDVLRRLAEVRTDGPAVLSVYLNLDPAQFATDQARASQIHSLVDEAHRRIEEGQRPHAELMSLRKDVERVREFLEGDGDYAKGAHGLAVFASGPAELFETIKLPEPVDSEVAVASAPQLAPLTEIGAAGRVCVAVVDARHARILRGTSASLREVVSFGDDTHGRHQAGGWSQARYQRSVQEGIEAHVRHTADLLHRQLQRRAYDRLLLAARHELWPQLVEALHPDVRRRLGERLDLDVAAATLDDVRGAVAAALADEDRERLGENLARLRQELGADGRAAAGAQAVLDALVQQRVEVLLHEPRLEGTAVVCRTCGWMGPEGERCPLDGEPVERVSLLEAATEAALRQSAEVMSTGDEPDLGPLGGIAALLRF